MCGIIGVTGSSRTLDVLLDGLSRLEYRGYDSAGVALVRTDPAVGPWRTRAANGTHSLDDLVKQCESGPGTEATGRHGPHPLGHPRPAHRGRTPIPTWTAAGAWPWSTTASSRTTWS